MKVSLIFYGTKTKYVDSYKENNNKFYQVEIEKVTFFDHDAIKLEIQQLKDNHK